MSSSTHVSSAPRLVAAGTRFPSRAIVYRGDPVAAPTEAHATGSDLAKLANTADLFSAMRAETVDAERVSLFEFNDYPENLTRAGCQWLAVPRHFGAVLERMDRARLAKRAATRSESALDRLEARLGHYQALAETRRVALGVCAEAAEALLEDERLTYAAREVALTIARICYDARGQR